MKVIIAGSRGITPSIGQIAIALLEAGFTPTHIISGTAAGVDRAGERWALANSIPVLRFPADWSAHGRAAGPIRNREMAKAGDAALVFWDGQSRGTMNMIDEMRAVGKPCVVVIHARPVLRRGDRGPEVGRLQLELAKAGYLHARAIDGIFGPVTLHAVVVFQICTGLETDGIVGPQTWAALDRAMGKEGEAT